MMEVEENKGVIAGNDVKAEQINIAKEIHHHYEEVKKLPKNQLFRKANLNYSSSKEFKPKISDQVLQSILSNRIIILNGESDIDVADFQYSLVEAIQKKYDYKVVELSESFEDEVIGPLLLKQKSEQIYLLNKLDVYHLNHDLKEFIGIALRKESYFIITTNSTKSRWETISDSLDQYWFSLDSENLYDSDLIQDKFVEELKQISFIKDASQSDSIRISTNIKVKDTAKHLDHPMKLALFLNHYSHFSQLPSDEDVSEILQKVIGDPEDIIAQWFRNIPHAEKLIAIAFALFEGMGIAQFFESLTRLAKRGSVWKISAPELAAADLKDLTFLDPFLHSEYFSLRGRMVSSRPDYRRVVFQTLWSTYRRHLMNVVPPVIGIIGESYSRNTTNWELFGTPEKRAIIRRSFVNAMSDFSYVNVEAVENILLELAATGHFYIQNLVASTLVRWRGVGRDWEFFSLLNRWQENESVIALVHEKLLRRTASISANSKDSIDEAIARIKSTVAITLSRAAEYDKQNELDQRLVDIYGEIARDGSEMVQFTIEKSLPQFIHKHLIQLRPLLFKSLMKTERYREAISDGIIMAFHERPNQTKRIVDDWLKQCLEEDSNENRREKATNRDNILLTILHVLAKIIDEDELFVLYSKKELLTLSLKLLKKEGRSTVRMAVCRMLAALIARDTEAAFPFIPAVVRSLKKEERSSVVSHLTSSYVHQRADLPEADYKWEIIKDLFIPVWTNRRNRPLTSLEKGMLEWVNAANVESKQLAIHFFLDIASKVEEVEMKFIVEEKARIRQKEIDRVARESKKIFVSNAAPQQKGLRFSTRFKIFFMLLFESKENRAALKETLRYVINIKGYKIFHVRIMNHKWKNYDPNRLAGKLGKWLERLIK